MKRTAIVEGRTYELNGDESEAIVEVRPGVYSILDGGHSVEARVVANEGGYRVYINGLPYEVEVFDPRDRKSSPAQAGGHGPRRVAAPMPGKVIRTLVEVGAEVSAGEGLVVVEAMKMQNEMKSPKRGRVIELRVRAGATVSAGEVLVVVD
jgi:biotin carboxyl carrier protein